MANPNGSPIWYELMTTEPDRAKVFYDALVPGWDMEAATAGAAVDYRMIRAPGGHAGGVLGITPQMQTEGARSSWLLYVGVEDVDRTVEQAKGLGARVYVPPTDIPDVGRFAFLADPQGAMFYVMRPTSEGMSDVFARGRTGRFGWNELSAPDVAAALGFYGALFGWENRETMDMGPMGGYHFLDLGDLRLGAAVQMKDRPPHWNLYITVPDIDKAVAAVKAGGGVVHMGPHEVPSGEFIALGADPQGAALALVAPAKGGVA